MSHKTIALAGLMLVLSFFTETSIFGQKLKYVGHRGASYLAPENTLASMKLAWELGADAAECDVMLSGDDEILLFHDRNTGKLTGQNHSVSETPWPVLQELEIKLRDSNDPAYLGEKIPLLEDVLAALPKDRTLVIEIKTGVEILPFLKLVLDKHWQQGSIAFIAFDFEVITQCKAIFPEVPCYYLSAFGRDARKHLKAAQDAGLDGLDLRHGIINEKMARKCREAGLDLWCWTVNDPETARRMRSLGVSAVTTDRPAWLKSQLNEPSGGI